VYNVKYIQKYFSLARLVVASVFLSHPCPQAKDLRALGTELQGGAELIKRVVAVHVSPLGTRDGNAPRLELSVCVCVRPCVCVCVCVCVSLILRAEADE